MTDPAYRLIDVSRTYEGSPQPAVAEVSLDIARGEFFGLLGRNGAGKSTLVKMMVGLLRPDRGEVHVLGRLLRHDDFAHLGRVGYMPQSAFALNNLTVAEAIFTVAHLRGKTWRQARADRDELVATLDLTALAGKVARTLSGGQRRLLQLAVTLAGHPDVLLLDEPTNELDPGRRRFVWSHLQALQRAGTTIVLVTHNTLEAEQVLERVGVMRQGRVVALGSPRELKKAVTGLTRVRFLRDGAVPLPTYLLEQDPCGPYVEGYLAPDEFRAFVTDVEIADLTDLAITSATLEDVYHGLA